MDSTSHREIVEALSLCITYLLSEIILPCFVLLFILPYSAHILFLSPENLFFSIFVSTLILLQQYIELFAFSRHMFSPKSLISSQPTIVYIYINRHTQKTHGPNISMCSIIFKRNSPSDVYSGMYIKLTFTGICPHEKV